MNNIKLMIGNSTTSWDVSELVQKIAWSGRRGSAPRTVEAVLWDNEQLDNASDASRVPADCSEGQTVSFYEDGKELFRGILMSEKRSNKRTLTIKAYDVCIRLVNNKDSFSYKEKRADQIFKDCLSRLGLSAGTVHNTGHVIGELVKKATTYWDVIEDALSQTYQTTGARYYVYADKGKINLVRRTEQTTMPHIELATSIESYDHTRSIENTRTRLKLVTSKGDTKKTTVVESLEKKIGKFQDVQSVDEKITGTEMNQRINAFRLEKAIVSQTLSLNTTGITSVRSGGCIYVNLSPVKTYRIMFVEEDTHTWEKGKHTMKLKLDYATEPASAPKQSAPAKKSYKVGDIVNFHGGKHYVSSYPGATGYSVGAGKAKITIANGSGKAHPWHLVTQNWSQTHVWGWVDDGSFD